jgi:hypothetical protein
VWSAEWSTGVGNLALSIKMARFLRTRSVAVYVNHSLHYKRSYREIMLKKHIHHGWNTTNQYGSFLLGHYAAVKGTVRPRALRRIYWTPCCVYIYFLAHLRCIVWAADWPSWPNIWPRGKSPSITAPAAVSSLLVDKLPALSPRAVSPGGRLFATNCTLARWEQSLLLIGKFLLQCCM